MEQLKQYLLTHRVFTEKELKSLKPSPINYCKMCSQQCGTKIELTECKNNSVICLECLDNLYDSYHINKNETEELFTCICCDSKILSYNMIG